MLTESEACLASTAVVSVHYVNTADEDVTHSAEGGNGWVRSYYDDVASGLRSDHVVTFLYCNTGCIAGPYQLSQPK